MAATPDPSGAWDDTVLPQYRPQPTGSIRFQVARRRRRDTWLRALAIGLAITLGLAAVGAGVLRWRHQVAQEQAEQERQQALAAEQQRREQTHRDAQSRAAWLEAERERVEADRIRAFGEQQRALELERRAEADAAARKEQAWARFYRAPALCQNAATMACTNAYIRAKREFEAQWDREQGAR